MALEKVDVGFDDLSLASLFNIAYKVFREADLLLPSNETHSKKMEVALNYLSECDRRIHRLGLFSANEELDDVATANLKFLLVPYMMGYINQRMPPSTYSSSSSMSSSTNGHPSSSSSSSSSSLDSAGNRIACLKTSQAQIAVFLNRCERLGVVKRRRGEEKEEDDDEDSEHEGQAGRRKSSVDAAARREEKIARFKWKKEVEAKLEEIRRRRLEGAARRRRMRMRKGTVVFGEENGGRDQEEVDRGGGRDEVENGDEGEEEGEDAVDESEEREIWILQMQLDVEKARELKEMLEREEEMLCLASSVHRESNGAAFSRERLDERVRMLELKHKTAAEASRRPNPPRTPAISCATLAQDVIEGRSRISDVASHRHQPLNIFGPVSLMGPNATDRQRIAAGAFQPSHSLPRMNIEEAGLREMRMMEEWKEGTRREMEEQGFVPMDKDKGVGEEGEGEEEEEEEDIVKVREWDDWKDEHPKGAGNSKLTPCG